MGLTENCILNHEEINHKVKRIAYQIYESNVGEQDIILAGIESNGYLFAKKLRAAMLKICDINPILCKVTIDKKNPTSPIITTLTKEDYTNKSLVLVDDVLNSIQIIGYNHDEFIFSKKNIC